MRLLQKKKIDNKTFVEAQELTERLQSILYNIITARKYDNKATLDLAERWIQTTITEIEMPMQEQKQEIEPLTIEIVQRLRREGKSSHAKQILEAFRNNCEAQKKQERKELRNMHNKIKEVMNRRMHP